MKANVTRTLNGLAGACSALSVCARYQPSMGYTWNFEKKTADEYEDIDPVALMQLHKRTKRRKILDNRKTGERNEAEEEGLRAMGALDQVLVRLSKSSVLTVGLATPSPSSSGTIRTITSNGNTNGSNVEKTTIAVAEPITNSPPSNVLGRPIGGGDLKEEEKQ
jgi:hypothetical protein